MVSNQSTFSSIRLDTVSLAEKKYESQAEISIDDHSIMMSSREMQEAAGKDRIHVKSELEIAERGGGEIRNGTPTG